MAGALTIFFVIIRVIFLPILGLVNLALYLLSPIWSLAKFFLLPFFHLARAILGLLTFPFRLHLLERIETLYIYLGTAGLVGCMAGTILFILFRFLSSTLNIDNSKAREKGRTTAEYRSARRQRANASGAPTPLTLNRVPAPRKRGLLSQAIAEEEDSDF